MNNLDISQYFTQFNPVPKQMKRLAKLLKDIHKWWGIDYHRLKDSIIEATLLLAPGDLSRLSPAAVDLLKRCQNRVWSFNVRLDSKYDPFHKQTYLELFELLLSLGLIAEVSLRNKLKGAKKVDDLRFLLKAKGVFDNGKKEELIDRVINNYSTDELENLLKGIILFNTTEAGNKALETIAELESKVGVAFRTALVGTRGYFEANKEPAPVLPPGVYYDDGEVRITEHDVGKAFDARSTAKTLLEDNQQEAILTFDLIQNLVLAIEATGNGWLTVLTMNDDAACFVQCSFMQDHPNKEWYFDASGNHQVLLNLGFIKVEESLLPVKWVSRDKVTETILDTLKKAFNIESGMTIWLNYEIMDR